MQTPTELKYSTTHQWARSEPDGTLQVGITDFAQDELGDIVFIDLPNQGESIKAGEQIGVVESVKTASEIYAPVSGTIIEINTALTDNPEQINDAPYAEGWICRIQPSDLCELDALMDAEAYQTHTA